MSVHIWLKDGSGLEVDDVQQKELYLRAYRTNGEVWWVPNSEVKMVQFKVDVTITKVKPK